MIEMVRMTLGGHQLEIAVKVGTSQTMITLMATSKGREIEAEVGIEREYQTKTGITEEDIETGTEVMIADMIMKEADVIVPVAGIMKKPARVEAEVEVLAETGEEAKAPVVDKTGTHLLIVDQINSIMRATKHPYLTTWKNSSLCMVI